MTTKQLVQQALDHLPDDATFDELIERLYFLRKIDEGIRQAEAGDVTDHEEFKREMREELGADEE